MKKLGFALLGLFILGGVTYLGYLSSTNSFFVWIFGVASFLLGVPGFALLRMAVGKGDDLVLKRLDKVPEITALVAKAESYEEKIEALELEKNNLSELIRFESKKMLLEQQRDILLKSAVDIIQQIDDKESKLTHLNVELESSDMDQNIERLRSRVKEEEFEEFSFKLGSTHYYIDGTKLRHNPLGQILLGYMILIREIFTFQKRLFNRS